MGTHGHIFCAVGPAVVSRLRVDVQARRVARAHDTWSDAVEEAIRVIEQRASNLATVHRRVIEAAIDAETATGLGPTGRDLTELLSLVDTRLRGDTIVPPARTMEQLLAAPCPTCGATVGDYCRADSWSGSTKILPLAYHHAERFWAADGKLDSTN